MCSISFCFLFPYFGLALRLVWTPCLKQQEVPKMWIQGIYCHPVVFLIYMGYNMCSICLRYLNVHPDVFIQCFGKIVLELQPCLIYFLVDVVRPWFSKPAISVCWTLVYIYRYLFPSVTWNMKIYLWKWKKVAGNISYVFLLLYLLAWLLLGW